MLLTRRAQPLTPFADSGGATDLLWPRVLSATLDLGLLRSPSLSLRMVAALCGLGFYHRAVHVLGPLPLRPGCLPL